MPDFEPFSFTFNGVNGQQGALLSPFDRGLAYGDGLFETMRLERGQLPFWSLHRERLLGDCQRLRIALDSDRLEDQLQRVLELASQRGAVKGVVKLIVTRGEAGRGYQPTLNASPSLVASVFPFPSIPRDFVEDGIAVYLCQHPLPDNPALAGIKHLNKLDHVLAAMEWRNTGCQEGLLFDQRKNLVEAGSRNVFVLRNGALLTPRLHNAGVAGVLRRRIMEDYAKKLLWTVTECSLGVEDLRTANEIFVTNSVLGVWPVRSLRGGEINELTVPGVKLGRELQGVFDEDIRARVGTT